MFDRDRWQEIMHVLRKNKMRTFLTAFGVFWGIFMLVVMLGAGKGLYNGVFYGMGDFALNSLFIWTEPTSIPYKGFPRGRHWNFTNEDSKALIDNIREIEALAPRISVYQGQVEISRDKRTDFFRIVGDTPEYFKIDPVRIHKGRFINRKDLAEKRKVIIIGKKASDVLFEPDENPIGEFLKIQGVYFEVVGVFSSKRAPNRGGDYQNEMIFMPFTTLQKTFNYGNVVGYYSVLAKRGVPVSKVEEKMKRFLARRHKVSPDDEMAFGSANVEENVKNLSNLFIGIALLSWFVGTLTLVAGVIGISNIMLVIVKERTKEIGIQRAIGATPMKIISQIILESVFLTTIAGYIGLLLATGIVEVVGFFLRQAQVESFFFRNPEVDLKVASLALLILILSGAMAGLIPARRAVKIKPIDALRSEI
ncbi:MAG: ABC transporter permease [Bacteroidales bacterium]|nr:MAG: ABC transporter permease [Bacteroidales bacterium]